MPNSSANAAAFAWSRLATATAWLETYRVFWAARLHDLKSFVESLPDDDEPPAPARTPAKTRKRSAK